MAKRAAEAALKTPPDSHVPLAVAGAECDGLSAERIRQLIKQGYIDGAVSGRGTKPGTVPLRGTMLGYIKFLKDGARRTNKSASASRVQDIRAKEIELRVAREEATLVPADDACAVIDQLAASVANELANLPARYTRDLTERERLRRHVDDALSALADRMRDLSAELRRNR